MKSGSLVAASLLIAVLSVGLAQPAGAHNRTYSLFILDGYYFPGVSAYRHYDHHGYGRDYHERHDYGHRKHHGHDRYRQYGLNREWRRHKHDGGYYD